MPAKVDAHGDARDGNARFGDIGSDDDSGTKVLQMGMYVHV